MSPTPEAVRTLADLLFHVRERWGGRADLLAIKRHGRLDTVSTAEFVGGVHSLAAALEARGVVQGERVALFAENCPEWHIADFACQLLGAVSVPLYPTLPAAQVGYILRNSGARWVFHGGGEKRELLAAVLPGLTSPPALVALDDEAAAERGLALTSLLGEGAERRRAAPLERFRQRTGEDDVASLIYTSGTTGDPKGVMLTQRNFVSNFLACDRIFPLGPSDVALSFLPLSHVFERTCDHLFFYRGVRLVYVPAIERVPAALLEVRPTVMASVPRLYERAYLRLQSTLAKESAARRRLFAWALGVGSAYAAGRERGFVGPWLRARRAVARRLVHRRVAQRFGGRLRFAISGGAALPREVAEFFAAMGMDVFQGYGLTESAPVLAANCPAAHRLGSVGRALPGVEIAIAEDGEILARSPGLMRGYWENPEATREAIDEQGWLHTGDIGRLDAGGFLFITDRKKDLLVTSGGKNIAPQPIEQALVAGGLVTQAVVVGDGYPYVTALLVPNAERLGDELGSADPAAVARDPRTQARIEELVRAVNSGLAEHERVRRFRLLDRELSVAEGELTPTLKVRRRVVAQRYADTIAAMYLKSQRLDAAD
jgi:long-chain acyl-CoA synthetase